MEQRLTNEPIRTRAVVRGDAVEACTPIEARRRPALVPVGLALDSCVPVHAITGVGADDEDIKTVGN